MKTSRAVLALLLTWAAASLVVEGNFDHTYITNESEKMIVATTSYPTGTSLFVDRVIPPFTHQDDPNSLSACTLLSSSITVTLWVEGSSDKKAVSIGCDRSLVAYDSADLEHVDVFLVSEGLLFVKDGPFSVMTIG